MTSRRLIGLSVAVLALAAFLLRVNVSPSLPQGLYCRLPLGPAAPGVLVALCLPPAAAGLYRDHGHPETGVGFCPDRLPPFLKAIAARGGEKVTFSPMGLTLAGWTLPNSAPRPRDRAGSAIPHAAYGSYRLPAGTVWLYAPHPFSFDSRYFGPVPVTSLLYRVAPLWTFTLAAPGWRLQPFTSHLDWSPDA